jgi:hypothetical protein
MSRKKKIFTIVHLCLAFSYLCWLLIQPYAKDILSKKSEQSLYQMVFEKEARFKLLTAEEQADLIEGYALAQKKGSSPWIQEIERIFFVETPPFALAWLFFSFVVCLLLLFRIEGAAFSVWLLPVITLTYAYFLYDVPKKSGESLFPTEEYVLTTYVNSDENKAMGQRERLALGWHRYLVKEWAHESPSADPQIFQEQLDKGLFAFNIARLKWILEGKGDEIILVGFTAPPSLLRLGCYFIWNLFFAWMINRRDTSISAVAPSNQTC